MVNRFPQRMCRREEVFAKLTADIEMRWDEFRQPLREIGISKNGKPVRMASRLVRPDCEG